MIDRIKGAWRRGSNRAIKAGFKTHKVGKRTRRAGLGVAGVSGATMAALGGATFVATGGRTSGIHPVYRGLGGRVLRLSKLGIGHFGVPTVARGMLEQRIPDIARRAGRRLYYAVQAGKGGAGRVKALTRVSDFALKHRLHLHAGRAAAIGLGVGAVGYGIEKVGSALIRRGFRGHKVGRKVKRAARL